MPTPYVNPNKQWQENPNSITSASITSTPAIPYVTPKETPIFPVASINPVDAMQQTVPEAQAQDANSMLQSLNKQLIGESTYRAEQERAQGIVEKQQSVNDLSSRLKALQNEALAIPLQLQQQAQGRGITAAGLQPHQTAALRNNAIQALSVNSLLEASRGNLTTAMDMADRAVKQRFDPIREQIAATQKNLQLIMESPAYSLADKKRAAQQQQLQEDRKRMLDNQEEDNKAAQAMAAAATKNFPNDPAAQMAIRQALAIDPSDPNYIQKVFGLIGQYQANPQEIEAAILDQQYKRQQIAASKASIDLDYKTFDLNKRKTEAEIGNINADAAKKRAELGGGTATNTAFSFQPAYSKLTAAQKKQADSLNNLVRSIGEYEQYVKNNVGFTGVKMTGKDAAVLQTKINSIIFAAAQAEGTGALQQADREVIEKIIPNPTNLGGAWSALTKGGKEGQLLQIADQKDKYTKNLAGYGLTPTDGGLPSPQMAQPARQIMYNGKKYNVDAQGNMTPAN